MNRVTKSPSDQVGSKGMPAAEYEIKRLREALATQDAEYRELCFLRHFYEKADFGPADSDVRWIIRKSYLGPIPESYKDEDE